MDGAGGADGRADTLRDGLADRQRHQCGRHAERVLLRHDHAGDGDDEHGVRHSGREMLGLRFDGFCGQPAIGHVSQHSAAGVLRHRQIRALRTDHPHDDRRELAADCLPTVVGREREGSFQTGAVHPNVPRDRRQAVAGVPRGTGDTELLALPYYIASGETVPAGVREIRRAEPERAGEHHCHQTGEGLCARGL